MSTVFSEDRLDAVGVLSERGDAGHDREQEMRGVTTQGKESVWSTRYAVPVLFPPAIPIIAIAIIPSITPCGLSNNFTPSPKQSDRPL